NGSTNLQTALLCSRHSLIEVSFRKDFSGTGFSFCCSEPVLLHSAPRRTRLTRGAAGFSLASPCVFSTSEPCRFERACRTSPLCFGRCAEGTSGFVLSDLQRPK